MATFRDDMPLIAGVDADWDDMNTYEQVKHPNADIAPIRMKTMHHLPQIFFDTSRPERPDCPVLIPNTFSVARDRLIAQDLYSYSPCGLPTGDLMPAEQAQIRLMTASPVTLSRADSRSRSGHARTGLLQGSEFMQENFVPHTLPVTRTCDNPE